jgi:hypothetical protein
MRLRTSSPISSVTSATEAANEGAAAEDFAVLQAYKAAVQAVAGYRVVGARAAELVVEATAIIASERTGTTITSFYVRMLLKRESLKKKKSMAMAA